MQEPGEGHTVKTQVWRYGRCGSRPGRVWPGAKAGGGRVGQSPIRSLSERSNFNVYRPARQDCVHKLVQRAGDCTLISMHEIAWTEIAAITARRSSTMKCLCFGERSRLGREVLAGGR